MIEHIQAVIFDIDGTLVDSNGMWGEIDEEYFKKLEKCNTAEDLKEIKPFFNVRSIKKFYSMYRDFCSPIYCG